MYEMKDEYLTGIEQIDNEHKVLFEIAEEIYQLCVNDFVPDKYDHIANLIQRLKDYAAMHFRNEEAYMESIQYKRMFTQKIQHDNFIRKLDTMNLEVVDENQSKTIEDLLKFVTDWMIEHIMETDKRIAE
ncbi:hemerythrin family protein [Kineothrix sedimenti]|uniref:Hemerythrin family protein n=1 Tax=Kineothrix sedimenti TaxID=3123317 RepID=A0ABZ3ETZ1_9FIRM